MSFLIFISLVAIIISIYTISINHKSKQILDKMKEGFHPSLGSSKK